MRTKNQYGELLWFSPKRYCIRFNSGKSKRWCRMKFSKPYTVTDVFHRKHGPAVIIENEEDWWVNGFFSRQNGPAYIHKDGSKEWALNHVNYSEEKYWNL